MQYKIRLGDGNSYERELGATVRASLSKAKAFIKLCTEDKPDMSNKIVEEGQIPAAFTSAPTLERSLRYYWGRQLWFMSHLWKRWVEEYLVTLTTREKWTKIRLQSENGDLVFLVEEGVTGGSWNYRQPFGQMVECLTERCSILEKNELLRSGIDKVCDSFEEKAKLHKVVKHVGGEISDPTENYCQSSTKKLKSSEQVQETRREQGPVEQSPNGTGRVQYRRGRRQRAGWPARVDGSAFPRDGRPSGGLGARPEGWRTGLRHRRLGEEPEALFGSSGRSRTTDRRAATAATAATPDKLPLRLESGSCRSSRSCSSMGKCWNSPRSRRSLRRASTEEPIWTPLRSSLTCCRARHSRHSSPLPGSGGYLIEAVWSAEDRGARALLGLVEGTGVPRDDMTGHSSFGGLNHQALKMSCSDGEGSPCWRAPVERSPDAWAEGKIPSRVAEGLGPKGRCWARDRRQSLYNGN
ncbi:DNA topoisomerase 2-alpha [Trichinella spiralis]|uniref:DNA topoisomerase 2-alpha n=1 Tax=Trichinella spiralis TaxID=6334 RepID=UPI0001EFBC89|nr:DNA topoisomerase 2-alpha [Trichinella spiralis]